MDSMKVSNKWTFGTIAIAAILSVSCTSGQTNDLKQILFRSINVPSTILQSAIKKEEFPASSSTLCILHGRVRQWCHLSSFTDNGICSLYDISLPSNYRTNDESSTDLIKCYTEHSDGCISDNNWYLEGESRIENCVDFTCNNFTWIITDGWIVPQDCPDGYESVHGVGCITVIKTLMMFNEAKQYCETLGARLVIPDNFEALRNFISCKHTGNYYIGISNDKWMDGRAVDGWSSGQPTSGENCGFMWQSYGHYIADYYCTQQAYLICQLV